MKTCQNLRPAKPKEASCMIIVKIQVISSHRYSFKQIFWIFANSRLYLKKSSTETFYGNSPEIWQKMGKFVAKKKECIWEFWNLYVFTTSCSLYVSFSLFCSASFLIFFLEWMLQRRKIIQSASQNSTNECVLNFSLMKFYVGFWCMYLPAT